MKDSSGRPPHQRCIVGGADEALNKSTVALSLAWGSKDKAAAKTFQTQAHYAGNPWTVKKYMKNSD